MDGQMMAGTDNNTRRSIFVCASNCVEFCWPSSETVASSSRRVATALKDQFASEGERALFTN